MKIDILGPSDALCVKVVYDEPTVVIHPRDQPESFTVHEIAPGRVIPLDDNPRRMCLTKVQPGSQRCACGMLEILGTPRPASV